MAAGRLPSPGTEHGPCVRIPGSAFCQHPDCAETRKMAKTICHFCAREIGYETRFYVEATTRQLVHAACLEDNP